MSESNSTSNLEVLAFDAYGTLFDVHSVVSACEVAYPGHAEAISRIWRAKQLEYTWLLSLMGLYEDFWAITLKSLIYACQSLGLVCDAETQKRIVDGYFHLSPYDDVPEALIRLADVYKLVVLSNGTQHMLSAVTEATGLTAIFDELISVETVCIYKPSPQVYGLLPQRLGIPLKGIGFVSANPFDTMGAKAFGLWTCSIKREEVPTDDLGYPADVTVSSLTELADRIVQAKT